MYNFRKMVLACLCTFGVLTVTLAVWSTVLDAKSFANENLAGCRHSTDSKSAIRMAGAWEAEFICDVVVFTFTVMRSYRQDRIPGSIIGFMFRDGAMYFAVLAVVNLANILMFYIGDPWTASSLSWFTSTISVTLICRLMLNLHEAADVGIFTENSTTSSLL
ncbi:hypothetical protein C8J57DRAFT_461504 [Mycena rebaudengoi]|nr:hypothetical protein C8J57DRAFT_461504 [Mycena rebaudengoi]